MTFDGTRPDVAVIGGGLIGCSIAFELAGRGSSVLVLERGRPAREATWAAGGMLSPLSEGLTPGPFLDLGLASLDLYPGFVDSIREASGLPVEIVESGKLVVAFDSRGVEALEAGHATSDPDRTVAVRRLTPSEILAREPVLNPEVRGGLLFEDEAQVDNRLLGRAAFLAAKAAGARIRTGARVRSIRRTARRADGVELDDGTSIPAGAVVVAAGAWSGGIRGLPRPLPVRPVRGQMLSMEMGPNRLSTIVETPDAYLIPRRGGPLVVGSTMEEAGFQVETTDEAIRGLRKAARTAVPSLEDVPPVERWAGLRPGSPDDLPILGADPELDGLFYATGHFRNGILLAPVTATSLGALITGDESPPVELEAFRPDRFPASAAVHR